MRSQCVPGKPVRVHRRGISIVLVGVVLMALIGFVSLAIDIGRLRLASAELQMGADAAARAGAWSLPVSSQDVIDESFLAASLNKSIDSQGGGKRVETGIALDVLNDIQFGVWNPGTHVFTPINGSSSTNDPRRGANAVRVETRRLKARGNPVKLIFAPVLGVFSSDVEKYATAYITGGSDKDFGFVGINKVTSNGNKAHTTGGVASDGNIDLINGDVYGYARPGINGTLNQHNNSNVTGWAAPLDYKLAPLYPPIQSAPASALPIPGGNNPKLIGGADLAHQVWYKGKVPGKFTVSGFVRIYATSNIDLKAITVIWTNPATPSAARLEYYMTGNVTQVKGNGSHVTYCHVYAPQCDVSIGGTADFNGWAIGKTLTFVGTSSFNYDGTKIFIDGPYIIHLVQ